MDMFASVLALTRVSILRAGDLCAATPLPW
jgi:hypothetical protein